MINYSGVSESRVAPIAANLIKDNLQTLIIVSTEIRAKRLAQDLEFFIKENPKKIIVLPEQENYFLRYDAKNHDQLIARLKGVKALLTGEPVVVIAPVSYAVKKLIPHKSFQDKKISLKRGEEIQVFPLREEFISLGYECAGIVESQGQFSHRGGIIDIFPPDSDNPIRIELFGDEIDSIRTFDIESQRSLENLKFVEIFPAEELVSSEEVFKIAIEKIHREYTRAIHKAEKNENKELADRLRASLGELCEYIENFHNVQLLGNYIHYFYDSTEYIWDYMKEGNILIDDPDRIYEVLNLKESEQEADFQVMLERGQAVKKDFEGLSGTEDFKKVLKKSDVTIFTPLPKRVIGVETFDNIYNVQSRQPLNFAGKINVLESELISYAKKNYDITIVCSSIDRLNNLKEFVERIGLEGKVGFAEGNLTQGIDFPQEKKLWLCESDIFAIKKQGRKKKSKAKGQQIKSFSDIREGDFVVHENHGVGKFIGIEQLSIEREKKDYIKIKYAGNDMLYVPVEQMDMVQKFIGGDSGLPRLNKLSGGEWKLTKAKAKADIAVMAKDLIELYAKRTMKAGHQFGEDTVWQMDFEGAFPYEETEDQLQAIKEIKEDMEKPYSMDRLLCGDVGFGKTEVAARAIFKCLADGKQAAFLVPTTILANQHFYSLKERFEQFPFKVEVLSRFRSQAQQADIIKKMSKGQVDLIIGTHRLLSKDIAFKDLGLLVIDEEQRFGVEDKEKIKKLKTNVDVLTLSATPIPRTLNMSLTGIKDMSLIEEPPEERYPVQTYVLEQDDQLLKEVIERELNRGGQAYVVYNRVKGIQAIAEKIENLVPEANVVVGHGQMNEHTLENVMLDFINGENNVLVATTIIESGLDIPNANTMVIMDSDRYGLSQLYQLRGRVGRSNKMAYAYLMYQKDKVLNEQAEKRLKAIKEFTEFGSGFKVAMKDLEIRGAGNLLGTAQSGHIANIGYELYCKMVDNAVRALQGELITEKSEDISIEIPVSAYIPTSYIENEALKIEMYQKIATVQTYDDEDEIIDELLDRFGDVPKATINLVKIAHIRYLAENLGVNRIYKNKESDLRLPTSVKSRVGFRGNISSDKVKLVLEFSEKNSINGKAIFNMTEKMGNRTFLHGGIKPFIRLDTTKQKMAEDTLELLEILSTSIN